MNENFSTIRFKREDFTDESYMNPRNDRLKYKDRDGSIGPAESKRRLNTLPLIEKRAKELAQELNVELPLILPKGSSVVNMATVDSDFDIAVIVESGHIFTKEPTLWRKFQGGLESLDFGFHIEPRLVVESRIYSLRRLNKLAVSNIIDDVNLPMYLENVKDLLSNS